MRLIDSGIKLSGYCRPILSLLVLMTMLLLAACSQKATEQAIEKPEVEKAQADDAEAAKAIQQGQQTLFDQGISALSVQDLDQARNIFENLLASNPELSGPYANLALINFKQQNFEQSLEQINTAIELNPLQAQAYHLRAQLLLKNGEIKKARDDYQKALDLNPQYANAHYNIALLYDIYLQEIALAIEHYSIYLSLLEQEDEKTQDWVKHLKATLENG